MVRKGDESRRESDSRRSISNVKSVGDKSRVDRYAYVRDIVNYPSGPRCYGMRVMSGVR